MIYNTETIDFDNIPECIDKVIALLAEALTLMMMLIKIPVAEPGNEIWDEFEKRPHIHKLLEVFCAIHDANNQAKRALHEIKCEQASP